MKEHLDKNGKRHRKDGPACEYDDGYKEWCIHGKIHREDRPAIEWKNGFKFWWWKNEFIMETKGDVTDAQIKEFRLRRMI